MAYQVNRYLENKAMDHIDHALGRPVDPMAETYRNHFATDDGPQSAEFMASPHWDFAGATGEMLFFCVTETGRRALADYLHQIGDRNRVYMVTFGGYDMPQVATSHAKARYMRWLSISDLCPDLSFRDFMASSRVRLAASN